MKRISYYIALAVVAISALGVMPVFAEEEASEQVEHYKARVVTVVQEEDRQVPATSVTEHIQTLEVEITEGERKGTRITLENGLAKLDVGDKVFLARNLSMLDGREYWTISEPSRLFWLAVVTLAFITLVIVFGGVQGLRGLVSLFGSLLLIIYVLLPAVIAGYSPIAVSIVVAGLIIVLGSYITHGFSRMTSSAVIGMLITVVFTSILAWFVVILAKLSGFDSDEAVYLNLYVGGSIDVRGILLGGILIGLLGALYDVAIGQSLAVDELHRIAPHASRGLVYSRAIRMGREHIGALVNTLAIAYVGAALPLLLLFYTSTSAPWWFTINREIFAVEIVRTMVGSIGLVLSVPITTLFAVWMLMKKTEGKVSPAEQKKIDEVVAHGHVHSHGHDGHHHGAHNHHHHGGEGHTH